MTYKTSGFTLSPKNKIKIYLPPYSFYRIVFLQANFEFINFVQTFCSNTVTLPAINSN